MSSAIRWFLGVERRKCWRQGSRSHSELEELVGTKPPAWEYLSYAAVLALGVEDLATRHLDARMGHQPLSGPILDRAAAADYLSDAFRRLRVGGEEVERWLSEEVQVLALGEPGAPGDAKLIEHIARRLLGVYLGWIDLSTEIRGLRLPQHLEQAFQLAAQITERPLRDFETFVIKLVERFDQIPSHLQHSPDTPIHIAVTLKVDVDEQLMKQVNRALRKAGL